VPEKLREMARTCASPRRPLVNLGGHWQRRVKKMMPDLPPGKAAPAGKPPGVHTSEYVHTIMYSVQADGQSMLLGSSSNRARLLHLGGEVRAKRKMLAIPIAVESYGRRPRDFQGLEIIARFYSDGMRKILLGRGGVPLFVLQPRVMIWPHPHLSIEDEDWRALSRALQRELDRAVESN
jgi:hypothetical protein